MRLKDRIGVITAGGSGMGRAGSELFAREGAKVIVVDANEAAANETVAAIAAAGGKAQAKVGNLLDDDFARQIVRDVVKEHGRIDFLWNHVGHPGPAGLENVDFAEIDRAMSLNLRTTMISTQEALGAMRENGGGCILFTASTSGLQGSRHSPIYSAAKFGVIGLAKSLAKAYAPDKIRINVVCPGATDTPMLRSFVRRPGQEDELQGEIEGLVKQRVSVVPMGRAGDPVEIANAALFLISDEASYITGVALPVDGGLTA